MIQSLLLGEFDRISNDPDAIARLRRFILGLAVHGKLVDQDLTDSSADQLIKQIATTPREVPLASRYRSLVDHPIGQPPFELPENWAWTRLGLIADHIQRGKSPEYSATPGPLVVSQKCVRWEGLDLALARSITPKSLEAYEPVRYLRDGDLLWNSTGTGTIGRLSRVIAPPARLVCDSHVTLVRCSQLDPEFIRCWLRSDYVYGTIEGEASGSTNQVELTLQMALSQPVPLPPLTEQHRIVAKVEELMALCDRLEAAENERESQRDALRAASLHRLTATEEGGGTDSDVRFFLNSSPRLITKMEHLVSFRQAILDLAIQGRLVPQNPEDEPVSELIKRIEGDKAAYRGRRAKRDVPIQPPFPTPPNWQWVRFGDVMINRDGERIPVSKEERIQRAKTYDYYGASGVIDKIDGYLFDKPLLLIGEDGANLVNRSTPIAFIARGRYWVNNHAHVLDGISEDFLRFIELFINAIDLKPYLTGTAQPKMNQARMNSIPVALPPEQEQERIVAKVDGLMGICDDLADALAASNLQRARLLDSVLLEALTGTGLIAAS
jgi:type I restriction enzyme S subunit